MRNPTTRQEVVLPWLLERRGLAGDWIHLDGKPLRQTGRPIPQLKALPMGRAWAGQTGLTLGQVAVDAKSNEITALPQLWELLDLRDKIVTTDAMGCPEDIAKTRVAGGGDYSLAVKDNQPPWPAELQAAFATAATPRHDLRGFLRRKTTGTGARNSARCRCCPRAAGQGLEFL